MPFTDEHVKDNAVQSGAKYSHQRVNLPSYLHFVVTSGVVDLMQSVVISINMSNNEHAQNKQKKC